MLDTGEAVRMRGEGSQRGLRVLVVTSAPDDRRSTAALRGAVAELAGAAQAEVHVWFLRGSPATAGTWGRSAAPTGWSGSVRVIDDLRMWWPVRTARRLGLDGFAGRIAGARLRLWRRAASPDVVVLDDALGGRLLGRRRPAVLAVRHNSLPPVGAELESRWTGPVDIEISPAGSASGPAPHDGRALVLEPVWVEPVAGIGESPVPDLRRVFGLPTEVAIVMWCGRSSESALDDLVTVLAEVEARGGPAAHGLVVDDRLTHDRLSVIRRTAEDRGFGDRIHPRPVATPPLMFAADAVVSTDAVLDDDLAAALLRAGVCLVSPPGHRVAAPALVELAPVEPTTVAGALQRLLAVGRAERAAGSRAELDAEPLAQGLLAALAVRRRPPERSGSDPGRP